MLFGRTPEEIDHAFGDAFLPDREPERNADQVGVLELHARALVANEAKLVDGNSVVVKLVGRGEAAIGLTDEQIRMRPCRSALSIGGLLKR